ncbi:MAG: UDP-N-acetylmuramate dehydrogenase [Candidatus Cryptobacteroides sp.]
MIKKEFNYSLSAQNTFRMKVSCACYIEYDSIEELKKIDFDNLPQPLISIGEASNILFTGDFKGTVLRSRIEYIKYFDVGADTVPLAVGAGVKWDDLVKKCCEDKLWGAENLSLIPGTVGAAAVQNIGAYGVEAKDIIAGVTCFDLKSREKTAFKVQECNYGYRDSIFKQEEFKGRYIITGVLFRLSRVACPKIEYGALKSAFSQTPSEPMQVREEIIRIRNSKLPAVEEIGSAGSFFKNPVVSPLKFAQICEGYQTVPHYLLPGGFVKIPAAWLIEQCGLKGASVGGAAVYDKQPLVLVNRSGEAKAEEILALEKKITDGVQEKFGIVLQPEVEHI